MDPNVTPYDEFKQNPNIVLCTTELGGHCTHLRHGRSWKNFLLYEQWFPEPLIEFLKHMDES